VTLSPATVADISSGSVPLQAHVAALLAQAPPLGVEQRRRLADLLAPVTSQRRHYEVLNPLARARA